MAESDPTGLGERVRALLHRSHAADVDAHAHNYLSVAGPAPDVSRFLAAAQSTDDSSRFHLAEQLVPIEYSEEHVERHVRIWGSPAGDRGTELVEEHTDGAYVALAFTSERAVTPLIREISAQYPSLTFRYAHFIHATNDEQDRFGGAAYRAGEELGRHNESADDLPADADEETLSAWRVQKFAAAIATTDGIEAPPRAA